ncbi:MAG: formate dehydrogenase subunit gamma [Desulfobulbaceae bacterium]|nr:formate dehydrogenase subunit gamma [Desulfobulbaceae bacterium]
MKRVLIPICIAVAGGVASMIYAETDPAVIAHVGAEPSTTYFRALSQQWIGDWQQYGQTFTGQQAVLFSRIFLLVLVLTPTIFLLHYIVVGAKKFNHDGPQVPFFSLFTRLNHWLAAIGFTLLVGTGIMVIFGKIYGGGQIGLWARNIHLLSAMVFTFAAVCMFFIWVRDMLPMPHDFLWMLIMGGYLSKKKKPVPAGKFNAGQKMWFWLATLGGMVMAYSGYMLWLFQANVDQLRLMAMIHNFLGAALVAFFITHMYMSLFAIKGSLTSMITGYKPREEVEILHSRYTIS